MAVIRKARRTEHGEAIAALDLIGQEGLIEPDQLDGAAAVFQRRFEDSHPLHRRDARMRGDHPAADENRRVDVVSEVGDGRWIAAIFVAVRKKPEEIARGVESVLVQDFRAPRADAFEELHRRIGRDHSMRVKQLTVNG